MDGKEQFGWLSIRDAIVISKLLNLRVLALDIVPADLAEENLPLVEERHRFLALCRGDGGVEVTDSLLRDVALGAEIRCQIFGGEGLALSAQ